MKLKWSLHICNYYSIAHHSQNMEAAQMSNAEWTQHMCCIHMTDIIQS